MDLRYRLYVKLVCQIVLENLYIKKRMLIYKYLTYIVKYSILTAYSLMGKMWVIVNLIQTNY